jgi:hypothetical protein
MATSAAPMLIGRDLSYALDLVAFAQACGIESDPWLAAVRPMLATRSDGAFIVLSTPAGKRGAFYDLQVRDG